MEQQLLMLAEAPVSDGMRAPAKQSDITKDWLEFILTHYENKTQPGTKVKVDKFHLQDGKKPGEGYISQMIKADINTIVTRNSDCKASKEEFEYHLMIKLPDSDPIDRQLQITMKMNQREFKMYSEVINDLNDFQELYGNDRFRLKHPLLIYGKCTKDESVLVMRNVKVDGFKNIEVRKGLNLEHILCVIEDLAKFHAVSYAYNQKHRFLEKYPSYKVDSTTSWLFTWHDTLFLDTVIAYLKTNSKFKDMSEKIEKVKNILFFRYKEVVQIAKNSQVTCLIHGDIWGNNLLFRTFQKEKERDMLNVLIIDWQMANWNSPILDLHTLLLTTTTREFRRTHLEHVLQFYHSTFSQAVADMGASLQKWTYHDFKKEYSSFMLFGLFKGLMIVQCVLCDFLKKSKPKVVKKENSSSKSTIFRKQMPKYSVPELIDPDYAYRAYLYNTLWTSKIAQEMIEGNNQELNNWVMDIIMEAEETGLFDNH